MGLNYPKYHQISYDVPRICNVTSEDFSFAAFVDRNFSHPGCATYGILQVIPFVMLFLLNTYSSHMLTYLLLSYFMYPTNFFLI